jgi:rhodanese-related sulfurtransferase/peroxiredoxin
MRLSVLSRTVLDGALVLLLLFTGWRVLDSRSRTTIVGNKNSVTIPSVRRGDIVRFPGVNWSAARTVVLVVSTTCQACNASTPFYKELAALATPDLEVVTVAPEAPDTVGAWLRAKGVSLTRIYQASDLTSLGFHMTPTLLIVDRAGRVTDIMIKKLQRSDERRVLDRLEQAGASPLDNSQQLHEFSREDIRHIRNVRLLDVRSRERFEAGHLPGTRNIPVGELLSRAQIELDQKDPIVVDCLYPASGGCRAAAWGLIGQGFSDVGVLIKP